MSVITSLIGIIIVVLGLYIFVKKIKLVLTILAILLIFYLAYHFFIPSIQAGGIQNIFDISQNLMNMTSLQI